MARVTRGVLKNYFVTGAKPSQEEFENLIDSFLHADDSSGRLPTNYATSLEAALGSSTTALMTPFLTKQAILAIVRLANIPALRQEVNAIIASIVGAAPASLNTLQEIAAALNNDANLYPRLVAFISQKADTIHTHDGSEVGGLKLWDPDGQGTVITFGNTILTIGDSDSSSHFLFSRTGSSDTLGLKAGNIESTEFLKADRGLYIGSRKVIDDRGGTLGGYIGGMELWRPYYGRHGIFFHLPSIPIGEVATQNTVKINGVSPDGAISGNSGLVVGAILTKRVQVSEGIWVGDILHPRKVMDEEGTFAYKFLGSNALSATPLHYKSGTGVANQGVYNTKKFVVYREGRRVYMYGIFATSSAIDISPPAAGNELAISLITPRYFTSRSVWSDFIDPGLLSVVTDFSEHIKILKGEIFYLIPASGSKHLLATVKNFYVDFVSDSANAVLRRSDLVIGLDVASGLLNQTSINVQNLGVELEFLYNSNDYLPR